MTLCHYFTISLTSSFHNVCGWTMTVLELDISRWNVSRPETIATHAQKFWTEKKNRTFLWTLLVYFSFLFFVFPVRVSIGSGNQEAFLWFFYCHWWIVSYSFLFLYINLVKENMERTFCKHIVGQQSSWRDAFVRHYILYGYIVLQ